MGFFRFSFSQPWIVLVWIVKYCNLSIFFSIKYLTWARKVSVLICAAIFKFLCRVFIVIARTVHVILNNLVFKIIISQDSCLNSAPLDSHIGKPDCFQEVPFLCKEKHTWLWPVSVEAKGFCLYWWSLKEMTSGEFFTEILMQTLRG